MKQIETNSKEPKEFYEHSESEKVNFCKHSFERISVTKILCKKCGLGFFDNPFSPFPIEEINRDIVNEQARTNYHKRKSKDIEKE